MDKLQTGHYYVIILISTAFALLLLGFIVTTLFLYQRRNHRYHLRLKELKDEYTLELQRVKDEVYRNSFRDLAGEIHDNFGQKLAVILMKLLLATDKAREPERASLEEIREMVQTLTNEMRQLSRNYYVTGNGEFELPEAIGGELARIGKQGISEIDLEVNGIPSVIEETKALFLYRMFQEALQNLLNHSQAKHGKVTLDYTEEEIKLMIADDGIGFKPGVGQATGVGLANLNHRCQLLGGNLSIESKPGKGTRVKITVPYHSNRNVHDQTKSENSHG